nr:ubiquitin-conjugating enzyme E2 variant 1D isoform X1 [Tanacetum cinerariifolium]
MQSKVAQEKAKEQNDQLHSEIRSLFVAGTSLVASKSLERRSLLAPVPESPTTAGMTIEIYTPPATTKLHIHKKAAHQASQNHENQMSSL